MRLMRRPFVGAGVGAIVAGGLVLAGGGSSSPRSPSSGSSSGSGSGSSPVTVRLGLLANITHAPALVAIPKGFFSKNLGSNKLSTTVYSSGTQETTAILADQLDAAYVGPNPAIDAFQKSSGKVKIISGVATGGASVVVKPSVGSAKDLKGQTVDTPSLGNTQDVAIRYWLKQNGLATTTTGGGDVTIKPTKPNSNAVLQFKSGQIAGASEPSPYDVQMVQDGGKVLFKEPGVTTVLVVT